MQPRRSRCARRFARPFHTRARLPSPLFIQTGAGGSWKVECRAARHFAGCGTCRRDRRECSRRMRTVLAATCHRRERRALDDKQNIRPRPHRTAPRRRQDAAKTTVIVARRLTDPRKRAQGSLTRKRRAIKSAARFLHPGGQGSALRPRPNPFTGRMSASDVGKALGAASTDNYQPWTAHEENGDEESSLGDELGARRSKADACSRPFTGLMSSSGVGKALGTASTDNYQPSSA